MVPVQPCPGVHREELRQEGVGASEGAQEAAELHEAAPRVLGFKPLEQVVQVLAQESVEARRQKALHVNLLPQDVNLALSQHALAHLKHSRPDLILIPFEVFSDAADSILGEGHKQHAFRELQAEVNLAFDQLVFHLADDVFASLKQVASLQCMDKDLQLKLADGLELAGQRLARHAAAQGQVEILGKKIDMKRAVRRRFMS